MFGFGFRQGHPREIVAIEEGFQFGGSALANANRLVAKVGSAARAGWHGRDGSAVPGTGAFGDLQTLRNVVRGTLPDLPGGERRLLPMPAARRARAWPRRL